MSVSCPWEMTASAPCSMVSLMWSCFSSLREICSDTHALLRDLEVVIVTQDYHRLPARKSRRACGGQISHPARKIRGVLQSAPDGAKFGGCRQLAFIAARNTC